MSVLPKGKQWTSHSGRQARIRNLMRAAKPLLDSTDQDLQVAIERVRLATSTEPEPEIAMGHLLFVARDNADSTGVSYTFAINYLMDQLEKLVADQAAEAALGPAPSEPHGVKILEP